jgi:uncharacterized protein YjbJ (UPF0337 family)
VSWVGQPALEHKPSFGTQDARGQRRQPHRSTGGWRRILPLPRARWAGRTSVGSVSEVGFADKFSNKVQELRGRMKRTAGKASGDRRLEAEGRSEEVRGGLKQAGEKFKDAFRGRGRHRPRH